MAGLFRPPTPNTDEALKPLPALPRPANQPALNARPAGRPQGTTSPTAPGSVGAALLPQMPAPYSPPPLPTAPPPMPPQAPPSPSAPSMPAPQRPAEPAPAQPAAASPFPQAAPAPAQQAPAGGPMEVRGDPWTDQGVRGDPWTDPSVTEQTFSYVPTSAELDTLPPGMTARTPWGPVQRAADGTFEVVMDEAGKAEYGKATARARSAFGPMPQVLSSMPGMPQPPVVPGRANFNPWLNLWS